jgi:hypothetical protein
MAFNGIQEPGIFMNSIIEAAWRCRISKRVDREKLDTFEFK